MNRARSRRRKEAENEQAWESASLRRRLRGPWSQCAVDEPWNLPTNPFSTRCSSPSFSSSNPSLRQKIEPEDEGRGTWTNSLGRLLFLVVFLLAGAGFLPDASAALFTANLDPETATVGESVTLSLNFEGGSPKVVPTLPTIPNLTISYRGPSSQFRIVNGRTSSTVSHLYSVSATQPGDYVIPALRVMVDGTFLTSQAIKLKVLKNNEEAAGKIAFLQLSVARSEVYVGEAFPVEILLYAQGGNLVQPPQLKGEGITFGKMIKAAETRVQTNNVIYVRLTYKVPVVVVKTGDLKLEAADCILDVQFQKRGPRNRDPFGFDDFFGGGTETRRFTLSSDPRTLHVLPVPTQDAPPAFNGAVGNFSMTSSAAPTNVLVGDPITVKVQIAGRGALDSLMLPAQEGWREFKTYPPTSKVEITDELGLEGVKSFEQVVIPQNSEVAALPEFKFSFFDPAKKQYRTLVQSATPLVVQAARAVVMPATNLANSEQTQDAPPAQDLVHIKPDFGLTAQIGPALIERPWFLALQGLPLAAWLAALGWRKRKESLAKNPRLRRKRMVARLIQNGLAELKKLALANRSEEFFATAFRLLQERLGERLDLPASAITEAVVEERLRPLGVDPDLLGRLHELFHLCNQARYAPVGTAQELSALVPQIESSIRALERIENGF